MENNEKQTFIEELKVFVKDSISDEMKKMWKEFILQNPSHPSQSDKDQIFAALSKAQQDIKQAKKEKTNPYFKSNYADLPSVWNACKDALSSNGLCISQTFEFNDGIMFIITTLGHTSGQSIVSRLPVITAKNDPQSLGSAITYFRRYSLSAIAGITAEDEDDDGEKAQGRTSSAVEKVGLNDVKTLQKMLKGKDTLMNTLINHLNKTHGIMQLTDIPVNLLPKITKWLKDQLNKSEYQEEENVA